MDDTQAPARTPSNPMMERFDRWISGGERGQAFGRWLGRTISLPQLRRLTGEAIPWTLLPRPIAEATIAIVTTSGVHLKSQQPFNLNSDSSFRVLPRGARRRISRSHTRHTTGRTPCATSIWCFHSSDCASWRRRA